MTRSIYPDEPHFGLLLCDRAVNHADSVILPKTKTITFGSIMRRIFSSLTIVQRTCTASTPVGAGKRLPALCCWLIAFCGALAACYDGITRNVQAIVLSV